MKSRTSYFDKTVFQKDVARFFPAWLLYSIFLLLVLVIMLDGSDYDDFGSSLGTFVSFMGAINFIYALLNTQLLFGDLYNSRMCNALHALPMRRETWFCTHVLAGLCFSLVPNAIISLICIPFLEELWYLALYWLLGAALSYLFCFGVALLSTMCVGSRFAMAVVYSLIHFVSLLVYWIYYTVYEPMLYGIHYQGKIPILCSPVAKISSTEFINVRWENAENPAVIRQLIVTLQDWEYLWIIAAVGIALGAAALYIYRRRKLESAGDFLAAMPLAPVFLILYSLAAGTIIQLTFSLFVGNDNLLFLFIGIAIGFFTGKMLLERTPRVFGKRSLLQFAAFVACIVLSLVLTTVDILGVTRWVPDISDVRSATFSTGGTYYGDSYTLSGEDEIADAIRLHEIGLHDSFDSKRATQLYLTYTLENGMEVRREYTIPANDETARIISRYDSTPEAVLGIELQPGETYLDHIKSASIYNKEEVILTDARLVSLLDAIVKDCRSGNMIQDRSFHGDANSIYITLEYYRDIWNRNYHYRDIRVFSDCVYTYEWLLANGFVTIELTK